MDPKNQPQFNPNTPISEVLKQEQTGYTPSAPTPTPAPIIPASQIKIIKTFRSDAEGAVKDQQATVAKIALAQEQQRRGYGEEIGAAPKKKIGALSIAIILIVLGGAAIPAVQYILNQKTKEVVIATEKTIIPFDHQETITLSRTIRSELLSKIGELKTKAQVSANFEYIKILESLQDSNNSTVIKQVASDAFADIIGPNMPAALSRSFDSQYMYGIEDTKNPKPFLLFKTSSYQQTFANMIKWENKMAQDLAPILNLGDETINKTFVDKVINNKDIRAVTTTDDTIIFLYGFLDNQTLIITTNTQTFQDINTRYVATQLIR